MPANSEQPEAAAPLHASGLQTAEPPFLSRYAGVLAGLAVVVVMFVPLIAIDLYSSLLTGTDRAGAGEATVGIAVILRATARRFLRGASSNVMRTTAGALGRTSARAATRRSVKFAGRLFFGSMVSQAADGDEAAEVTKASQIFALAFGFLALCLSFRGILMVVPDEIAASLLDSTGLGTVSASLLAGLPLLLYAALHLVLGRKFGVRARYRTELDGVLLQAYFTGAGSFLPLTTDVDYEGSASAKSRLATWSIFGLFALHILFHFAGEGTGSAALTFLSSVTLLYAFVYCFPIQPLEGHFIWSSSKLVWALVTLPILIAFLFWLPPVFGEIL